MPIYEFYCSTCHTLFNFLARTPQPRRRPSCPRCGKPRLERKPSAFAISEGRPEPEGGEELPPGFDEARLERMMAELAEEVAGVDQEDPRAMARMLRKLIDGSGMPLGGGMEEAIRRMEAGEDPDRIEEEMGDLLEAEDASMIGSGPGRLRALRRRLLPPAVDGTLHEL
jgi:putative FmdB family regulatory protein